MLPNDIEKQSFEIISTELGEHNFNDLELTILKRVIHTTADFEYVKNLKFSDDVVDKALNLLRSGCVIVTDTNMVKAGINKKIAENNNIEVVCFMADDDVAKLATLEKTTRAAISIKKASKIDKPIIFAIGNAPTALITLNELINSDELTPELIIGVPVGFVNVVESKELIIANKIPYIVSQGRKGGSNVAAAIVNALLYMAFHREGF